MQAIPKSIDRVELRRDRRYFTPSLDVTIGAAWFHAVNWSMGGLLLDGVCRDIGSRVRGTIALSGSCDIMPFAATVVRVDPEFGRCAICYDDPRADQIDEDDNAFADRLH
jgi:hypothetical protein